MLLTVLAEMAADTFGDRILIGSRSGGITARQLCDRGVVGAGIIKAAAANAVVYLAGNGPAFPVAMFAAAYAGVPLVPLNYRLGVEQLAELLSKHPGALAVTDNRESELFERHGIQTVTPAQWLAMTAGEPGAVDAPEGDGDAVAIVLYTSGTTSAPKGVLLRHRNLTAYVLGSVDFASADERDAALVSVPPYHIAGVANVLSNLFAGRRTIVLAQFKPEDWLETVRSEAVTHSLVVPTMLARIIDSDADKAVPSLRALAYGGAPMPGPVIDRALRLWPEVAFVNAYGLTETSSTIAVLGPDDHRAALASDEPQVRARLTSAGRVVPSVEVEIRDADGVLAAPGVAGRIFVRGDQVAAEYTGSGPALDDRGFFDTRDEGYLDADGYLYVAGRSDDTIIRGGENIAPAEIEDVLLRLPDVVDVAVVGVPDEEWGQRIEAAVVLRPGSSLSADALRAAVASTMRSSKTPDRFYIWSELPRTETGKLVRRQVLAKMLAGPG